MILEKAIYVLKQVGLHEFHALHCKDVSCTVMRREPVGFVGYSEGKFRISAGFPAILVTSLHFSVSIEEC
jgi:hypothetical protein